MRILVAILNIISSLASLLTVILGFILSRISDRFMAGTTNHFGIAYGVVAMLTFVIIPMICVMASASLARQDRPSSIFVSLIPAALSPLVILLYYDGYLGGLEHTFNQHWAQ
jgi:ABC-type tungstate transport system substrate-binding protein